MKKKVKANNTMEDFIKKLTELASKAGEVAKGTGRNMMRGLDGTAMEEMRQSERARNAELIEKAYPGGMRAYMRDNGMMTEEDINPSAFPKPEPAASQYSTALRAILNKP